MDNSLSLVDQMCPSMVRCPNDSSPLKDTTIDGSFDEALEWEFPINDCADDLHSPQISNGILVAGNSSRCLFHKQDSETPSSSRGPSHSTPSQPRYCTQFSVFSSKLTEVNSFITSLTSSLFSQFSNCIDSRDNQDRESEITVSHHHIVPPSYDTFQRQFAPPRRTDTHLSLRIDDDYFSDEIPNDIPLSHYHPCGVIPPSTSSSFMQLDLSIDESSPAVATAAGPQPSGPFPAPSNDDSLKASMGGSNHTVTPCASPPSSSINPERVNPDDLAQSSIDSASTSLTYINRDASTLDQSAILTSNEQNVNACCSCKRSLKSRRTWSKKSDKRRQTIYSQPRVWQKEAFRIVQSKRIAKDRGRLKSHGSRRSLKWTRGIMLDKKQWGLAQKPLWQVPCQERHDVDVHVNPTTLVDVVFVIRDQLWPYLDLRSICRLESSCRDLFEIMEDYTLWRQICRGCIAGRYRISGCLNLEERHDHQEDEGSDRDQESNYRDGEDPPALLTITGRQRVEEEDQRSTPDDVEKAFPSTSSSENSVPSTDSPLSYRGGARDEHPLGLNNGFHMSDGSASVAERLLRTETTSSTMTIGASEGRGLDRRVVGLPQLSPHKLTLLVHLARLARERETLLEEREVLLRDIQQFRSELVELIVMSQESQILPHLEELLASRPDRSAELQDLVRAKIPRAAAVVIRINRAIQFALRRGVGVPTTT